MSCQLILKRSLQSVSAMADHSALQTAPKCWLLANSKLGSVSTFLLQISQGVGSGHRVGTTFFSGWTLLEVPGKSNLPWKDGCRDAAMCVHTHAHCTLSA